MASAKQMVPGWFADWRHPGHLEPREEEEEEEVEAAA